MHSTFRLRSFNRLFSHGLLVGLPVLVLLGPATPQPAEGCGGGGWVDSAEQAQSSPIPTNGGLGFLLSANGVFGWGGKTVIAEIVGPDQQPIEGTTAVLDYINESGVFWYLAVWKPTAPLPSSSSFSGSIVMPHFVPFTLPVAFSTGAGPASLVTLPSKIDATLSVRTKLGGSSISCTMECSPDPYFGGSEVGSELSVRLAWQPPFAPSTSALGLVAYETFRVAPDGTSQLVATLPPSWDGSPMAAEIPFENQAENYCVRLAARGLPDGEVVLSDVLCVAHDDNAPKVSALQEKMATCPYYNQEWTQEAKDQWCLLHPASPDCPGGGAGGAGAGGSGEAGAPGAGGAEQGGAGANPSGAGGTGDAGGASSGGAGAGGSDAGSGGSTAGAGGSTAGSGGSDTGSGGSDAGAGGAPAAGGASSRGTAGAAGEGSGAAGAAGASVAGEGGATPSPSGGVLAADPEGGCSTGRGRVPSGGGGMAALAALALLVRRRRG